MAGTFRIPILATCSTILALSSLHADVFNMPSGLTSLQFVTIGNAGNAADTVVMNDSTTGYGSVGYNFNIGKFDVTAGQYCAFLNAVATAGDDYGLYNQNMVSATGGCNIVRAGTTGSYSYSVASDWANRPVNFVSWGDAARFCNWLQNGQPTGSEGPTTTEKGAYDLNGAVTDAALSAVTRSSNATYFLPNENEWYKAAYYDPTKPGGAGYWAYSTKSNSPPTNVLSATGTNNANYDYFYNGNHNYTIGSPYYRTEVGAFAASPSAYGTFDQGGNVYQWLETKTTSGSTAYRILRGGSYSGTANYVASSFRNYTVPGGETASYGFRVASIMQSIFCVWQGSTGDTMTAWGVASNWNPDSSVPDGPGTNVLFGAQAASSPIVDMISIGRTVGNIIFAGNTTTLIQSTYGYALTLDNRNNLSTIDVTGNHYISAPVSINNDTKISGVGSLTLWAGISGNHTLTVTGTLNAKSVRVDKLVINSAASAQSVPEPGVFVLLLVPGFALGGFAWRRCRAHAGKLPN